MFERIREKLEILADAAKYDVSCSSSGSNRKNENKGLGDAEGTGICHTYTEDGRCVSLLKILLTNHCIYDCAFCVSRRSNDVKRAAFSVDEVVELTMNFYRRNYIEGLFLSSGIFKNADYTMERLVRIVKKLRNEQRFNGYIHLKTIPGASEELLKEAGLYADRMSINLEMPTESGLKLLAPEKSHEDVKKPLGYIQQTITQFSDEKALIKAVPKFVPAGQSTQMVIGATPESDKEVMHMADSFYKNFSLKRVYYSGYIPISNDSRLPIIGSQPPLIRENRLYQTDWLMRFYGFDIKEILNDAHPNLEVDIDPKLSWALRHLEQFPVDVNTADYKMIMRVPGIGVASALKIVQARKFGRLHQDQLKKIGISFNKAKHFIRYADSPLQLRDYEAGHIKGLILSESSSKYNKTPKNQLSIF
ncbi:putative DNA modification/repair radical SAM protein [Dyadobacter fanqingshengii]|uniref:DNA modification/repair radical SAM protein n=1 Tax=Dyadobacter fanqingshengii TaxID=2906443 RepID=A0A9X1PAG3_9BACT|nr:putative DNA modification/repair radical SAM protein [Dyadobacter fanqingshengii]MCF0040649.1 putative DNA modification/repair radical SAM protein [Dyadobacter fanqingshengii]MCF2501749.1 putative DNA modification/repair radical SAM protein [Dyadobacter fanqingshengii]USJ37613.1 putative DNA modification/repair radical SAM protein [Dyadobacter fanqingshengii]